MVDGIMADKEATLVFEKASSPIAAHLKKLQLASRLTIDDDSLSNEMMVSATNDESATGSCSSESETGSNNIVYLDLCRTSELRAGSLSEILTPVLDQMRQALVDRVMEKFWVLLNQGCDTGFVPGGADASPSAFNGPSNSSVNFTIGTALPQTQRKRKSEEYDDHGDWSGKNS
jgi:hypothetical protein